MSNSTSATIQRRRRVGMITYRLLALVSITTGAAQWTQRVGAFVAPSRTAIATGAASKCLLRDDGCCVPIPLHSGTPGRESKTTRLSSLPEIATMVSSAYGTALVEYPLPTKSLTAGALCGVGDILAQNRDPNNEQYNLQRTLRFASKGCFGGILWSFWYDQIDGFLHLQEDFDINGNAVPPSRSLSLYALTGTIFPAEMNASFVAFAKAHIAAVTTVFSILIEQFVWCPLVYGTFEIPVSTLMNGGEVSGIQGEVKGKLNGLLVSNAKVWTLANLIIYNSPLEWRLFIGNCIDIFWQSIVSDVSADCGGPGQEECPVETTETPSEQEQKALLALASTTPAGDGGRR